MKSTIAFLRLIRINNLLIMLGTQVLAYFCLNDYLLAEDLINKRLFALVLSTLLTGAAGYIINDYHDVKLDMVNKPDEVIVGNEISRRVAMLFHLWFSGIAILLGAYISFKVAVAIFISAVVLWLYSTHFKRQFLSGNMIVAGMSAFVILILKFFSAHMPWFLVLAYSGFAFMISLIREIIKDAEDVKGDSKFDCHTIPIVLGIRKTKRILVYLNVIFILMLLSYLLASPAFIHFNHSYTFLLYGIFLVLFVIIPLAVMTYIITLADVKRDFTRLSAWCKFIMLTGMLSMILLKI